MILFGGMSDHPRGPFNQSTSSSSPTLACSSHNRVRDNNKKASKGRDDAQTQQRQSQSGESPVHARGFPDMPQPGAGAKQIAPRIEGKRTAAQMDDLILQYGIHQLFSRVDQFDLESPGQRPRHDLTVSSFQSDTAVVASLCVCVFICVFCFSFDFILGLL